MSVIVVAMSDGAEPRARGGLRRRLAKPLLVTGSLTLTLLLGELGARALGVGPIAWGPTARLIARDGSRPLDCYASDPRDYFDVDLSDPATRELYPEREFRVYGLPDLDSVVEQAPHAVELRFNSFGLREAELGPARPGVRRVAVLGDSFTQGQGVRERDTYPRVLEALLAARDPGRWEVQNWGRRAADFPELGETFDALLAWEPDLVVYGMMLNDVEQSDSFRERQRYLDDWVLERRRQLSRPDALRASGRSRLLSAIRDRLEALRVGRESTRWYRDMYRAPNAEGWARTRAAVADMGRRMRERGGYLLVASWPLLVRLESYPFADIHARVGRFCLEQGIDWHGLQPALSDGPPTPKLWVHGGDRHPNEIAHQLAAESLVEEVLTIGSRW